ncbi:MAG TPA: GerMN domain-containing protein [Terriglobales bacterium]|nr:GerMN domain-containing protein [Terriglobales bacterium]
MIPRHLVIAVTLLAAASILLGYHMLRLQRQQQERATELALERPVAPPVAGREEPVVLVIAYDGEGVVRREHKTIVVPEETGARAREILRALLAHYQQKPSPHPIDPEADVRDAFMVRGDVAVIDMNAAFADGHRSGVLVETLTVVSLVDTLTANLPTIRRVKFLVDGRERETLAGHFDLMAVHDTGSVRGLIEEVR